VKTDSEKLKELARAVVAARGLRMTHPAQRGPEWKTQMRDANDLVNDLVVGALAGELLPEVPGQQLGQELPDVPELVELPEVPPVKTAERKATKPKPKKRGGQHGD
jgi:hypothetical protein